MGNEASKTIATWGPELRGILSGEGLDIGAGPDPVSPKVTVFDQSDGDANVIDTYIDRQFDYVFSSHCLEHMTNPRDAIRRWWKLVKAGGHLIVIVPDEELYEQGYWPSLFNEDHKYTFTLGTQHHSPESISIESLITPLIGAKVVSIQRQSDRYSHSLLLARPRSRRAASLKLKVVNKIAKLLKPIFSDTTMTLSKWLGAPVDQTGHGALAQIQIVLRKEA